MPVLYAGHIPTAAEFQQITSQIDSLTAPGWTTFVPVWTTLGTAPALGNGTFAGRYRRAANSDLVFAEWAFTAGSTTTFGTSSWLWTIPVTASGTAPAYAIGAMWILDSGTQSRAGVARLYDTTHIALESNSGTVTNLVPQTFAVSDQIRVSLAYEPA